MPDETPTFTGPVGLAAIDPGWNVGTMNFGGIQLPMISLTHPQHGMLHTIVPFETVRLLVKLLTDVLDGASPAAPANHVH